MKLWDSKVRQNLGRYLWQCALATAIILGILLSLDTILHTAIISTLGASTFIVFAMPKSHSAQPRPLLGGYFLGTLSGLLCSLLTRWSPLTALFSPRVLTISFGAVAVGLAIFAMVVTNTEHPPAAGMALSLVLNSWGWDTIAFVLCAVLLLSLAHRALRNILIDLV